MKEKKIIRLSTYKTNPESGSIWSVHMKCPVLMASLNEMDACRKCWDGSRVWPGLNVVMSLYKESLEKDSFLSLIFLVIGNQISSGKTTGPKFYSKVGKFSYSKHPNIYEVDVLLLLLKTACRFTPYFVAINSNFIRSATMQILNLVHGKKISKPISKTKSKKYNVFTWLKNASQDIQT